MTEFAFDPPRSIKKGITAISHGRLVFTGQTHGDAYRKFDELELSQEKQRAHPLEEHFITNNNRLVDRKQGMKIANKAKQVRHRNPEFPHYLESSQLDE